MRAAKRRMEASLPNYLLGMTVADTRGIIWNMLDTTWTTIALASTCKTLQAEGYERLEPFGWSSWRTAVWAIEDTALGVDPRMAFDFFCMVKYHLERAREEAISTRIYWEGVLTVGYYVDDQLPSFVGSMNANITLPTGARIKIYSVWPNSAMGLLALWMSDSHPRPCYRYEMRLRAKEYGPSMVFRMALRRALYPRTDFSTN